MGLKGSTCVLCINNMGADPLVMGLKGSTCVLCINNMERILWLWT